MLKETLAGAAFGFACTYPAQARASPAPPETYGFFMPGPYRRSRSL